MVTMSKGRKGCLIFLGIVAIALVCATPWLVQVALTVRDAKKSGWLDDVEFEKYRAGRENNLKAIQKALLQAADSDGQLPPDNKWMESALIRLKTSDLSEDETKLKLKVPGVKGDGYGYAMNTALTGKKSAELKDLGGKVLVYESTQSTWDAVGDPDKDARKNAKGVTVAGDIVEIGPPPKPGDGPAK